MSNHVVLFISMILILVDYVLCDCRKHNGTGLGFIQYGDVCILGGHEKFLLKYKRPDVMNAYNASVEFECKLCDTYEYLDCFRDRADTNPKSMQGKCDCISVHSKGYTLVYDQTEKACRGYINSTCSRTMLCHSSLDCILGQCQCNETTPSHCAMLDKPRPASHAHYTISRAIRLPSSYTALLPHIFVFVTICIQ